LDSRSPDSSDGPDGHSSFKLEISIAVGYQRKRARIAGKWEGPVVTLGLLLGGVALVFLIFWRLSLIQL
jgi:hypothetical protein